MDFFGSNDASVKRMEAALRKAQGLDPKPKPKPKAKAKPKPKPKPTK